MGKVKKIVTVLGARPQFIKAAALSRAVEHLNEGGRRLNEVIVHTGQHYDDNMSEVFFREMGIPKPQYSLALGALSQGAMTGRMLESIEEVLIKEHPDWVLVFGDTNSTLAGALAAAKLHIPVAHVEAGVRSFNRKMPEEINRILTDHCATLLFTPSITAANHLKREGISERAICEVGDVMYDAALYYQGEALRKSRILEKLNLSPKEYALATVHRAENTDDPGRLKEIFLALSAIGKEARIVMPLHPRTRKILKHEGLYEQVKASLILIEPVGYLDMIALSSKARLIMTDSGGLQKEAFFFKVPCLTLRTETEWTELVDHGFNRLVPLTQAAICAAYQNASDMNGNWNTPLFGSGEAAKAIVETLLQFG